MSFELEQSEANHAVTEMKSVPVYRSDFWDSRATEFSQYAANTGYPEEFIRILKPRKQWTVLDMACGGGTIAIPLSGRVKYITAVGFSQQMLDIVERRCQASHIENVRTILGHWEDDWSLLGIGVHDVVIASRSLIGDDPKSLISKLNRNAREAVYLAVTVGSGPFDKRLFESTGRKFSMGQDYIYYYNLLYEMGIRANVAFIPERHRSQWNSFDDALADQRWMFQGLTPDEEEKVRIYLKRHLVKVMGHWRLPYSRQCHWAVMWWEKNKRFER